MMEEFGPDWIVAIGGGSPIDAAKIMWAFYEDPEITYSMPDWLTANTGMDALAHALETYVATMATDFTDPLAMQAIKMVMEHLPKSYKGDKDARAEMHYAQCMAGQAFTNAMLGIVHSIAHKTGAVF